MEESPFRRIRELLRYAFTKDDYNDPHRPPPPQELKEFGQNTMLLLGAGLIFGGVQQVIQERRQPPPTVPPAYSKAEAAKLLGELNTRRLIRVMNSSLRGGLWCGWLGALYFGVEGLAEYGRNVLAGLAGYPIGYLQVQFKEQRSPRVESQGTSVPNEGALPYPVRNYDVVGAVINKLDESLKDPKNV